MSNKLTDFDKLKVYKAEYDNLVADVKRLAYLRDLMEKDGWSLNEIIKVEQPDHLTIVKLRTKKFDQLDANRIKRLEQVIHNINEVIDKVKDEELKLILKLKILQNKTYREIAKETYMDFSCIRRKYKRFIKG